MKTITILALLFSLLLCGCGSTADTRATTASTRTGGYLLEEPLTAQEITYSGSDILEEAQAYLAENEGSILRAFRSRYEQVFFGDLHYILQLSQYTIPLNEVRCPIAADGKIVGWLSIAKRPGHELTCALFTAEQFDLERITAALTENPDTDFLYCHAGNAGLLLSPENEIILFAEAGQDVQSYFDSEIDYYTAFADDLITISYDSTIGKQ